MLFWQLLAAGIHSSNNIFPLSILLSSLEVEVAAGAAAAAAAAAAAVAAAAVEAVEAVGCVLAAAMEEV